MPTDAHHADLGAASCKTKGQLVLVMLAWERNKATTDAHDAGLGMVSCEQLTIMMLAWEVFPAKRRGNR